MAAPDSSAAPAHTQPPAGLTPEQLATMTPEQKDEWWLKNVYQGDRMPQLTVRAVVMGGFLGMVMSAANLYTTLSIGWAFGIAITACVLSFVIWNFVILTSGKRVSQMSVLENACMASCASAAGYSTGSTIATMFGALVLLEPIPEGKTTAQMYTWEITPPWVVVVFTLCTGLMGVFLAIPMKRQQINHEQLPFPTGTAAAETLRSLYSQSAEALEKAYVLVIGLAAGLLIGFFRVGDDVLDKVPFLKRFFDAIKVRIPTEIEMHMLDRMYPGGRHPAGFAFEPSALLIAAGMIVGMRISLSLLVSSILLYAVVGPWLAGMDEVNRAVEGYKLNFIYPNDQVLVLTRWSLWGGTSVMVFASLMSVALQWKTIVRAFTGGKGGGARGAAVGDASADERLASIEVPGMWMIAGMLPITIAMVWLQWQAFQVDPWWGVLAVAMSFVLSMVASRATGETDTTPIGAMGKVMQLLFAVLHPGQVGPNLASAGIAANSASSSADLLTDLKTGYLLGANPRKQFIAQFCGCFFGTVAIVPIWYLMVPTREKLESFALPATRAWEAVARILTKGVSELPTSAVWAIFIGAFIGCVLPVIEKFLSPRARRFMPSATGIGLAWVMPFQNAFSFFVGACIIMLWVKLSRKSADKYNISLASGLIAGESLMAAALAITATVVGLLFAGG